MAITKTDFLNYTRCDRYVALEQHATDFMTSDISFEEYKQKEQAEQLKELYDNMIQGETKENKQLEAMLEYYKKVEEEAFRLVKKYFGGTVKYAFNTLEQKSFQMEQDGIRFLCYVDLYNEQNQEINIIEVKATTSKKYTNLVGGEQKKSIWKKQKVFYTLKGEIKGYPLEEEMPFTAYQTLRNKLLNRYDVGEYFHDLAVQRFILEEEYKQKKIEKELVHVHYYLAVLNEYYTFSGHYENNQPVYDMDEYGNELISFFQADEITKDYLPIIQTEAERLKKNLLNPDSRPCPLTAACGYKKQTCCPFFHDVCGKVIPEKNSSLTYLNNGFGFVKPDGSRIKGLELINENYYTMLDIPETWIKNPNHFIQRNCVKTHQEYLNVEKIKAALNRIEYPIYHLDFETFPCPVPRFRGEHPYTQSPFLFSLHIEREPGVCDRKKDNVLFLATTMQDERKELVQSLLEHVDVNKGTLFAQNVTFEKGRIKELASIFPEYHDDLMKLYNRGFDLLWIISNHKELYQKLGFDSKNCQTVNYYHEALNGSYSIKKTLPVFSTLSYQNLMIHNGTEAFIEYASYDKMDEQTRAEKQEALKIYCSQDTWAMVEILNALRQKINICQNNVKKDTEACIKQ